MRHQYGGGTFRASCLHDVLLLFWIGTGSGLDGLVMALIVLGWISQRGPIHVFEGANGLILYQVNG